MHRREDEAARGKRPSNRVGDLSERLHCRVPHEAIVLFYMMCKGAEAMQSGAKMKCRQSSALTARSALAHGGTEQCIHAGLIATTLRFEPGQNVGINPDSHGLFDGTVEFPNKRTLPICDFRNVGGIDIHVLHFGQIDELFTVLFSGFGHKSLSHAAWLCGLK